MKKGSRRARQEALRRQKQKQRIIWGMGIIWRDSLAFWRGHVPTFPIHSICRSLRF